MHAKSIFLSVLGFILLLVSAQPALSLGRETDDEILRNFLWEELIQLPKNKRPQIGVALSAGGVRGFAHVGVLEVLDNAGLPIDSMAGTSMGSVVGALYSAGVPTSKLWEISRHMTLQKITPDLNVGGLLRFLLARQLPSSSNMENFLNEQLGEMRFEDMQIPFSCAAMDAKTGERVLFNSGPLAIAVRASMNLPGIFAPVEYRHRQLVDGAVVDYLPTETLRNMGADYIIASVTPPDFSSDSPQSIAAYFLRVGDVRGAAMIEESSKKADFVITNRVLNISTLELNKLPQAGEVGLKAATLALPALQEDLLLKMGRYVYEP